MTLGLTFLSFMSVYLWKNYILNFKKLISLTLRDTFERTPKVSVTKIYSVAFNNDADFDADHDAEILCKRITQSDWPSKFWGLRVFHYSRVGVVFPNRSKSDQISTHQSPSQPHPKFYIIIP